jgi:glyceraldehyde 3-phosphate dehydrogenase
MTVRVGISGCGRIGREVLRATCDRKWAAVEIVAVHDRMSPAALGQLLRHDSTHGKWPTTLATTEDTIVVGGCPVLVTPAERPRWGELGVDVVIETGAQCPDRDAIATHIASGARKAVLTEPCNGADVTIVIGVNDDQYDPYHHVVVSSGSSTTHCVAPMIWVLHRAFGVRRGLVTAIHGYGDDQNCSTARTTTRASPGPRRSTWSPRRRTRYARSARSSPNWRAGWTDSTYGCRWPTAHWPT